MEEKAQIATGNLWAMGVLNTLCGVIFLLPTAAVEAGGRAAWMVAVGSGMMGWATLLMVGKLSQRFPQVTLAGYAQSILGRWLGLPVALTFALTAGAQAWVDLNMAMRNLEGVYFIHTPPQVIAFILAVMALSGAWFGLVHISRLAPALLALLALAFVLTVPMLWRWVKPGYLIPLFDLSPLHFADKPFWAAMALTRTSMLPIMLLPYAKAPRKAVRTIAWAFWTGMVVNFMTVVLPIMVFSPVGARALDMPFPYVISVVRVSNFVFERMEMIGRLVFHINTVYAVSTTYFGGGLVASEVFRTKSVRPFVLAIAVLSMVPTYLVPTAFAAKDLAYSVEIATMLLVWSVFPLMWLVFWIRGLNRPTVGPNPEAAGG